VSAETAHQYQEGHLHDAVGRLDAMASVRADGTLQPVIRYPTYDDAGNRLARVDATGTTDYAYDSLHRLTKADPPGTAPAVHYAYDRAGNRTHAGAQDAAGQWTTPYEAFSYEPAGPLPTHRLDAVRDAINALLASFDYDANGNLTTWARGTTWTLTWDTLDRLSAIDGGFEARYVYDPLGRRIEKTEAGETFRYQYDGLDVVAEYAVAAGGASSLAATWVFGPGLDEPLKIRRGATLAAYHGDGLGSILAVSQVTATGATDLLTYRYDAFGGLEATSGSFDSTYTFTGRELDRSGLYYYRARYYLPEIGRFLSPDPLGLAGGINPYAYVGNNPVNFTDPFGLAPRAAPPLPPAFQSQSPFSASTQRNLDMTLFSFSPAFERVIGGNRAAELAAACGGDAGCLAVAASMQEHVLSQANFFSSVAFGILAAAPLATELGAMRGLPGARGGFMSAQAGRGVPEKLYHYGFARDADNILKSGLRPGGFTTPRGDLSPLQAQIDLALPPNRGLREALFEIDVPTLRRMGVEVPPGTRIGRDFNMPGGEIEHVFDDRVPAEAIRRIR
jgi:RHS repeat-associated protein